MGGKKMSKTKTEKPKVVAIVGATGSGKTSWAKIIAQNFNGQVISVDSRQIYHGLDIGTAKDKTFPQALIDIVEPSQVFTLSDYQKIAYETIKQILKEDKLPILAGGTGLYLDAVVYGYKIPDLREESIKLRQELEKMTDADLYQKLIQTDPDSACQIDPRNKRRVIRALEVSILSDQPFSELKTKKKTDFKTIIIGIDIPRETLYAKVDARVDQMIKEGLVEEVRALIKKYPTDLPALNTIGYKEIISYLQGFLTLKEAVEKIKTNTHSYIRRQDTWFRRNKDIKWVKTVEEAEKLIRKFIK